MTFGQKRAQPRKSLSNVCMRENQLGKLGPATEFEGKFALVKDAVSACDEDGNFAGNRPPDRRGNNASGSASRWMKHNGGGIEGERA